VTGLGGAEGKDHLVSLNSGEVKRVLMGSLAGPESPNPWSQRTKLRAAMEGGAGAGGSGRREKNRKRTVATEVSATRTNGFVAGISLVIATIVFFPCERRRWSTKGR